LYALCICIGKPGCRGAIPTPPQEVAKPQKKAEQNPKRNTAQGAPAQPSGAKSKKCSAKTGNSLGTAGKTREKEGTKAGKSEKSLEKVMKSQEKSKTCAPPAAASGKGKAAPPAPQRKPAKVTLNPINLIP